MDSPTEFVLTNAKIVAADRIIEGWVAVAGGRIAEIGEGRGRGGGLDMAGDYIIPGLIELHTDHLEAHLLPRPKVRWDIMSAILAYDAQMAASGVTTVFDSLRVGAASAGDSLSRQVEEIAVAMDEARTLDLLRCEHLTHLRCEIATPDVVDDTRRFVADREVNLISLMDHTPGQRQFCDLEKMRSYYARHGFVDAASFDAFVVERLAMHEEFAVKNRRMLVSIAHEAGAALASHDDATRDHVDEAIADRVSIAEFPTTIEAAEQSHDSGVKVLMGAPNIVRGGSHSGNVAAKDLAEAGRLDILSSDYVPASLILAAFALPRLTPRIDLGARAAAGDEKPRRGDRPCRPRRDRARQARRSRAHPLCRRTAGRALRLARGRARHMNKGFVRMTAPLGPGCLALVVGPSGCRQGHASRDRRAPPRGGATRRLRPPDRHTRGRQLGGSRHDEPRGVRDRGRKRRLRARPRRAHGLGYGVPREAATDRVEAGETVVYNVSRAAIEAARAQFAEMCA